MKTIFELSTPNYGVLIFCGVLLVAMVTCVFLYRNSIIQFKGRLFVFVGGLILSINLISSIYNHVSYINFHEDFVNQRINSRIAEGPVREIDAVPRGYNIDINGTLLRLDRVSTSCFSGNINAYLKVSNSYKVEYTYINNVLCILKIQQSND